MLKRFSWGGLAKRSTQDKEEEEEDVEVVEFYSGAATSDTTEKESRQESVQQPAKKQRTDTRESREQREPPRPAKPATNSGESEYISGGDVSLLTPPTKRRRMLAQSIPAMETLIEVIADEEEVLSTRLEYCSSLWRFVREMHSDDVVEFVRQRGSSVVRVIEALLHTGYFPLQQLCFMTVAAILYQLHKKDTEAVAAFVVACRQYLSEVDVDLLDILPLHEAIPWHDPRVARQRILQINRRTGLCNSFRASRCWVSPNGKQELARIRVNKWIDIGSTTTTFYWRDELDVVVVNVPHSCVEDVEVDRENCVLYVWTKHIDRLKGVRLLAFSSVPADFPGLVKALAGVEIEGYVEPPNSPSRDQVEFDSPIQAMKTASTLVLSAVSPPRSPATTIDESDSLASHPLEDTAFENEYHPASDDATEQDAAYEQDTVFEQDNGFEPDGADDDGSEIDEVDNANVVYKTDKADKVDETDNVHETNEIHETDKVDEADKADKADEADEADEADKTGGADAGVSDEDATESMLAEDDDSPSSIEGELDSRLARANRRTSNPLKSLHKRLDASKEALTEKFSLVSSARLESSDQIADRVYKLRARVDILQKKRLLDLPNAEFSVEDNISQAASEANDHLEEALDYASENLIPDEPDLIFTTTSIVMLLIVVIPWVLFAALHSGTDMDSVRQLAGDGMVLLTAMLRKFSGSG